jgi:hypothetical protein
MAAKSTTTEVVETEVTEVTETVSRIPEAFKDNAMITGFFEQYLGVVDLIAEYNASVLKTAHAEWDRHKLLAKGKELGRPFDANVAPVDGILELLKSYENAMETLAFARDALINATAGHLGVSLSTVGAERDKEKEVPLQEARKTGVSIGNLLNNIAAMNTDPVTSEGITKFLNENPLPVVGRNDARALSSDASVASTPKYRLKVVITKDGAKLLEADGITKAVQALNQPVFGYAKGTAPKADVLRKAWEAAGNGPGKTVQSTVTFQDNGLEYSLIAKS